MILLADGGSTKADWVALDSQGNEVFRTRTNGINPEILRENEILERIFSVETLMSVAPEVTDVYFYGAGCGTQESKKFLAEVLRKVFVNAHITAEEDMLAAVYAASGGIESIVCILGTGSNSCYYDGSKMVQQVVSLGYMMMDEAGGVYFGKKLILDYYYNRMPQEIRSEFEKRYNLDPHVVKHSLYKEMSPNAYLGNFAQIMFDFQQHPYILEMLEKGFIEFYECRVVNYAQSKTVPVFFIGSIAHYFEPTLRKVAQSFNTTFGGVIQRPIDGLIEYHRNQIISNAK